MGEIVVDLKLDFVSEADRSRFSSAIESFGHGLLVGGRWVPVIRGPDKSSWRGRHGHDQVRF